jgi:hypothetical protein
MSKNLCGKTRSIDSPYEIWEANGWIWKVLKKYQSTEKEETNQYARWFVAVKSPYTHGTWDMGDNYCNEIKRNGRLTFKLNLTKLG